MGGLRQFLGWGLVGGRGDSYQGGGGDQWRLQADKRDGVARQGNGSAASGAGRAGRAIMLGAMMYPTEETDLDDMRVPPIQLEHLPEVFLCTYTFCSAWFDDRTSPIISVFVVS